MKNFLNKKLHSTNYIKNEILQCFGTLLLSLVNVCSVIKEVKHHDANLTILSQVSIVTRTRSKDLWHFIMYVCGRNDFGGSPIRSVIWQKLMTGVRQGFVLSCYLLSDAWCSDRDLFRSNHLTVGPPLYSTVTFTSYLQKLNHPYHLIESRFVSPNKVIGLRLTRSLS